MYFDVFIAKAKKKKKDGDWGAIEIPQCLKYLPCKHEDLNSILCIHMKTLLVAACACNPRAGEGAETDASGRLTGQTV